MQTQVKLKKHRYHWERWIVGALLLASIDVFLIAKACPQNLMKSQFYQAVPITHSSHQWQEIKAATASYLTHYIY